MSSKSRGFTLIEVLVSVVIFSVGLLGLAGLQATGLKLNQSSMLRSQATLLAYDALDSMRANKGNIGNYALDESDCISPYSTPTNQAQRDIDNWLNNMSSLLPQPQNCLITLLGGGQVQIQLDWDDSRGAEAAKRLTLVSDI